VAKYSTPSSNILHMCLEIYLEYYVEMAENIFKIFFLLTNSYVRTLTLASLTLSRCFIIDFNHCMTSIFTSSNSWMKVTNYLMTCFLKPSICSLALNMDWHSRPLHLWILIVCSIALIQFSNLLPFLIYLFQPLCHML